MFIGPSAHAITGMGDKLESKRLAMGAGVNVIPGNEFLYTEYFFFINFHTKHKCYSLKESKWPASAPVFAYLHYFFNITELLKYKIKNFIWPKAAFCSFYNSSLLIHYTIPWL